jgi:non-specific serine/threonine protein kinase
LPAETTSFVGRQRDIADVRRLVAGNRLVTLTGTGGTGKTRLALRVAGELRRTFADGVWHVDLAEVTDGSLVEYAIGALPHPNGARSPADRQFLLVLDNCEHVLDAVAARVEELLGTAPGVCVLCTSRQPLGLVGETVWTVPPLPVPPEPDPPDAARYPAVALFVERAGAVAPGFTLTPENTATVAAVCRRLDGLPLAIELAAGQLRSRSLDQLASGLDHRFRLLSSRHAIPAHHARLRDTFDWSYALCAPAERASWLGLSVFAGFDLAGATAVCAGVEVPEEALLDSVIGLVDKSIVTRDETGGPTRYRMLETVREYGLERLGPRERARLRRRHRDWYLRLAERLDAEWFGAEQPRWSATIRVEYPNLRAALGWSLADPGEAGYGARLAGALRFHWIGAGNLAEGRYWLRRALQAYPEPDAVHVAARSTYTRVLIYQSEHAEARVSAGIGLRLATDLGDPALLARATQDLAMHHLQSGADLPRARALLEEALERHAALGGRDRDGVAQTRMNLGMCLLFQGDLAGAAAHCARGRAFCASHDEQWMRSRLLFGSAMVALAQRDAAAAVRYLRQGVPLYDTLGDVVGMAVAFEQLAEAALLDGDPLRTARLQGAAARIRNRVGGLRNSAYYRRTNEASAAAARAALGDEAYQAAYRAGRNLSPREAVGYAVEPGPLPTPAPDGPAQPSPLTRRERQVAQLIAEGLPNKQIAARLLISQRTAESHVENILAKLGFTSRTQVATWVAGGMG